MKIAKLKPVVLAGIFFHICTPLYALTVAENDTSTTQANSTVQVLNSNLSGPCTGTLIQPDIVVTAGHCMLGFTPTADQRWRLMPGSMNVRIGVGNNSSSLLIRQVSHYNQAGFDDIILLGLSSQVPGGLATPRRVLSELSEELASYVLSASASFRMVGWGLTETGFPAVRKTANASGPIFPHTTDTLQPNVMRVFGEGGSTILGGDSGGPLYWTNPLNSVEYLIGVAQGSEGGGGRHIVTFGTGGADGNGAIHPNLSSWIQRKASTRLCEQFLNYDQHSSFPALVSWWSWQRGDNFATTDPNWSGCIGDIRGSGSASYRHYRVEGKLFKRDPYRDGTFVELHSWYSEERGDNFVTTDPYWIGSPGETRYGIYRYVRSEGFVFSPDRPQPFGTIPLYSWYSADRGDNFITTNSSWSGRPGDTRYGYRLFRIEGYVIPYSE